ncbi:TPA: hypothetical protein ACH3X2_002498 [Trebouxia sp. C0005]
MPLHVAATLAFVWKQGFYEHNCKSSIYNWLYHSLQPQRDQSSAFEGKEPIVHRLIIAVDVCNWRVFQEMARHRARACKHVLQLPHQTKDHMMSVLLLMKLQTT